VILRKGGKGDATKAGAAGKTAAGTTKAGATRPRAKESALEDMVMGMAWI
jgi:hypothetical protein